MIRTAPSERSSRFRLVDPLRSMAILWRVSCCGRGWPWRCRVYAGLRKIRRQSKSREGQRRGTWTQARKQGPPLLCVSKTYIILLVLGENSKILFQKRHKLIRHLSQFRHVAIRADEAVSRPDRVVDEEEVRKLAPRALVVGERQVVVDAVRADLHQGAVLGTAAGPAVEPDDGSLFVGDVLVLEVPEEEVAVGLGCDFDVSGRVETGHVS